MRYVALLGAGFSKNWHGWLSAEVFDYFLTCSEIRENDRLRRLLWDHKARGNGFEGALEELQRAYSEDPETARADLQALERSILRMLSDMNSAFLADGMLEFDSSSPPKVASFLAKFDAIFSLNQDLLLEHRYKDRVDISLLLPRRWGSVQFPGLKRIPCDEPIYSNSWARSSWVPLSEAEFQIHRDSQPIFKLHGSSNWRTASGGGILVMGGQKARQIGLHPILRWYADEFERILFGGEVKLMVIGYGFHDDHINKTIIRAAREFALTMFIMSPEGAGLARGLNQTYGSGLIPSRPTELEEVFEQFLCGASTRPLQSTFSEDAAEYAKVQRFFE